LFYYIELTRLCEMTLAKLKSNSHAMFVLRVNLTDTFPSIPNRFAAFTHLNAILLLKPYTRQFMYEECQ